MTDGWFRNDRGNLVKRYGAPRKAAARGSFPLPQIMSSTFDEPVQSMANGRWYSNKADLSASHRADGNPQGVDYVELGNDTPQTVEHVPDRKQRRREIKEAMDMVTTGNLPDHIAAIQ